MKPYEKMFLVIILLFVFALILLPFIALDYFTSERKSTDTEYGAFTNPPSGVDDYNYFYWNNGKYVFFKYNYPKSCYIAAYDEELSKSQYKDKSYNVKEMYATVFKISEDKCKSIKSVLMSDNFLYALTDNSIDIYNLKTKKKKIYRLKNYKVYGINNNEIYFEYKYKKYKSNRNITKREKIDKIPKNFKSVPQEFDYSKDEA